MIDKEMKERIIKEFLARIEDNTGTVKRYARSLKNADMWQAKEASNGT